MTDPTQPSPQNPAGARSVGHLVILALAAAALAACGSSGSSSPQGAQGPQFVIASPKDGAIVSGPVFFAVQPLRSAEVQGVTFTAGGTELRVDAPGEDTFKVFLVPRDFPDGTLTLHATVTGKDGKRSEHTITVNVVADPPSSGTVGAGGATLGTHEASGAVSTLTIPPGVAQGATVAFAARSKAEVKAATGIDYDALGVTFLGAQEIDSTLPIAAPVGVTSGGFGPMVQPGQAVLNYMILPDGDGDGIGELVAVNGATVAPGGDIVSNPVPQPQLGSSAPGSLRAGAASRALAGSTSGPPGSFVELEATGFNLFSPLGNLATFHSLVSGKEVELPAFVSPHLETSGSSPTIGFWLPVLPAGEATVTLRNVSTGTALAPISITIEAPPPLSKEAAAVIDDTLAEAIRVFSQDPGLADVVSRLETERSGYAALAANPSADEAQALSDIAVFLSGSNVLDLLAQLDAPAAAALASASGGCSSGDFLSAFADVDMGAFSLEMGAINIDLGMVMPPFAILGGADLFAGGKLVARGMGKFLSTIKDCLTPDPPVLPPIEPTLRSCNLTFEPIPTSPPPSGGPDGLRAALAAAAAAPPPMTGMGSVIPPGGDACGSALGDPQATAPALRGPGAEVRALGAHSLASALGDLTGRFVVKVFFGSGSSVPFSGVSDSSGYFYIPVVPAGQPFQAIAVDTLTGETRQVEGVGPEVGQSTFLSFDFFSAGTSGATVLAYDTNTQGSYGDVDLYLFTGKAGDIVNLAVFSELSPLTGVRYQLADANGIPMISGLTSGGHYLETRLVELPSDGLYSFTLDGTAETGGYTLGLAHVDPPTPIDISLPLAGNLTTVGESQFFSFPASAGDLLSLQLGPDGASVLNADLLVHPPQTPFYSPPKVGELFTTSSVRTASGSVTLGSTGDYILELKHDDPFEADLQRYLGGYRVDITKTP